jgi:hypothetical protein
MVSLLRLSKFVISFFPKHVWESQITPEGDGKVCIETFSKVYKFSHARIQNPWRI